MRYFPYTFALENELVERLDREKEKRQLKNRSETARILLAEAMSK